MPKKPAPVLSVNPPSAMPQEEEFYSQVGRKVVETLKAGTGSPGIAGERVVAPMPPQASPAPAAEQPMDLEIPSATVTSKINTLAPQPGAPVAEATEATPPTPATEPTPTALAAGGSTEPAVPAQIGGQPEEDNTDLLMETVSPYLTPELKAQLQKDAIGNKPSLSEVFALAGVFGSNPQMGQMIVNNRNAKREHARGVLTQLQGQSEASKRAMIAQERMMARYTKRSEDQEKKYLLARVNSLQEQAAKVGAEITAPPANADVATLKAWQDDVLAKVSEVRGDEIEQEQFAQFVGQLDSAGALAKLGADPQAVRAFIENQAKMLGKDPAKYEGIIQGYASAARQTRTIQEKEIVQGQARIRQGDERLDILEDNVKIASRRAALLAQQVQTGKLRSAHNSLTDLHTLIRQSEGTIMSMGIMEAGLLQQSGGDPDHPFTIESERLARRKEKLVSELADLKTMADQLQGMMVDKGASLQYGVGTVFDQFSQELTAAGIDPVQWWSENIGSTVGREKAGQLTDQILSMYPDEERGTVMNFVLDMALSEVQ